MDFLGEQASNHYARTRKKDNPQCEQQDIDRYRSCAAVRGHGGVPILTARSLAAPSLTQAVPRLDIGIPAA